MSAATAVLGSPNNPVKYLDQDYEVLKAQYLKSGKPFEDEKFPASPSSMKPGLESAAHIEWKRPKEINADAQFIVDGATRDDIIQGSEGVCSFLSSIAVLTMKKEFLNLVVPWNQSFQKDYCGIFHFKFWQEGDWVEVVVDDRLPVKSGTKTLWSAHSQSSNEFWSPLLEKAYAKLEGSYKAIGEYPSNRLIDLTGGVIEFYELKNAPADLFQLLQKRTNALIASNTDKENKEMGLFAPHTYSVIDVQEITHLDKNVQLIKLRNPHGAGEWKGAWRDTASEWNEVDKKVLDALHVTKNEGEFWMPFFDFKQNFSGVVICHTSLSDALQKESDLWNVTKFYGSWTKNVTAGGPPDKESFWTNPKFFIKLEKTKGDQPLCTIVVSLMQRKRNKRVDRIKIQYSIIPIPKEVLYSTFQKMFCCVSFHSILH
ncbi:calpain-8-like isoform X1 [Pelobates cultripes]|uniref:Calpain-8-like isoform X1 n=1 Tax=Pelobates cultripes TaxID=61616 RepID=A0AAD1VUE3_PELCU|nr:calpain-8-like isoform X1 [Pelobates cultripes]